MIDKDTAQQVANHLTQALSLDPDNSAIKKTTATRMQFTANQIKANIAKGQFPVLERIRAKMRENTE